MVIVCRHRAGILIFPHCAEDFSLSAEREGFFTFPADIPGGVQQPAAEGAAGRKQEIENDGHGSFLRLLIVL